MTLGENGKQEPIKLSLTREGAKKQVIESLMSAGILLRDEVDRYGKLLDSYDNLTLTRVLVMAHSLREICGDILT
ncbi:unnamed protein product [marine sediment metagenome]|uniref:Uncharacterized protein n=1 Tax=marine sediment metagenome TaxID=412755 RepID=X1R3B8_9ZZZZ